MYLASLDLRAAILKEELLAHLALTTFDHSHSIRAAISYSIAPFASAMLLITDFRQPTLASKPGETRSDHPPY